MAEIKFTTARMREVYNTMGELIEQLTNSMNNSVNTLAEMKAVIVSTLVNEGITKYQQASDKELQSVVKNLNALKEYLSGKIAAYSASDEVGANSLSDVEGLLAEIEGMWLDGYRNKSWCN